ncbi:MAG TPA: threonine--tRNA ligase [bacterium]|nr:threonine--tRNA ligase [bacterium]
MSTASSPTIKVTLPDGSVREVARGTTVLQVAEAIGPRLAKDALAGKTGETWLDLRFPLESDIKLKIITTRDAEGLEVIRHSAEHILADAVKQLWPDVQIDVGRTSHEEKFQYDFDLTHKFSTDDLAKIEAKMREIIARDVPFTRKEVDRDEAKKLFAGWGENLKVSRIDDIKADQKITLFNHGSFTDLCRGPHVQRSSQIGAIKLLEVGGSYWRGDERNKQLQRIYGTAFLNEKQMKEWERLREEAEKRDHRRIGKDLDLFSISEEVGGGLVLWHPKGAMVRKLMEDYWREQHLKRGYKLVNTPHIGRAKLWETSGHLGFYKDNMFASMEIEDDPYYAKPMNCPFHIEIFKTRKHSYRELPIRLGELGTVYRYERSGVLHGLMRVRGFTQDDSHIFCTPEQVEGEIANVTRFALELLRTFGFTDFKAYLATKPEKSVGDPEKWNLAIESLKKACDAIGLKYELDEGGGAFYGPKIDIKIQDAIGRYWQCSTVQFDFNEPERFDLSYVGSDNKPHRPFMVHRALYGSMERFFGVLIEHHEGKFPLWLAPVQVRVIPISEAQNDAAQKVADELSAAGIRAEVDLSTDHFKQKIAIASKEKIPLMGIVGAKEAEQGGVAPRRLNGEDLKLMKVSEFIQRITDEVKAEMKPSSSS